MASINTIYTENMSAVSLVPACRSIVWTPEVEERTYMMDWISVSISRRMRSLWIAKPPRTARAVAAAMIPPILSQDMPATLPFSISVTPIISRYWVCTCKHGLVTRAVIYSTTQEGSEAGVPTCLTHLWRSSGLTAKPSLHLHTY